MPQPRNVLLNYDAGNASAPFGPAPRQVRVGPSDTIVFRIGGSTRVAHPGCKLRITLHNGQHFSSQVVQHGPGQSGQEDLVLTVRPSPVAVLAAAATNNVITGYKCELLDSNGVPIPGLTVDGSDGGEIIPDSN